MEKRFLLTCMLFLSVFCVNIFAQNRSRLENAAGNLKAELEFMYDFFEINKERDPNDAAWIWCDISHFSWKSAASNSPGAWSAVVSPSTSSKYNYVIARVTMVKKLYTAQIIRYDYKDVCQILTSIFGKLSTTKRYGLEYTWKTRKGIFISVEKVKSGFGGTIVNFELPD